MMSCFQNLSDALDDTFSATVQSEDELDYASATLVLGKFKLNIHQNAINIVTTHLFIYILVFLSFRSKFLVRNNVLKLAFIFLH